jgi:hypothetical protein
VLTLDGGRRHDLDEVSVEGEPDAEEGVYVVGGAPAEDPVEGRGSCFAFRGSMF